MEIMVDVFLFVTSFMDFLASFFLDPTRVGSTDSCRHLAYCSSMDGGDVSCSLASN